MNDNFKVYFLMLVMLALNWNAAARKQKAFILPLAERTPVSGHTNATGRDAARPSSSNPI